MGKTKKELAFLRDLSLASDWTQRFTDLVDESLQLPKKGKFLYFNTGTANHALELREKLGRDVEFFGISEDAETLKIARAKAAAVKADITLQQANDFADQTFDAVLADATLVSPKNLPGFFDEVLNSAKPGGEATFFLPTAGSFGEIFSYLWEAFVIGDAVDMGAEVERLIRELPTVEDAEEAARKSGLKKIETQTKIEIFEYENGDEFVTSPVVADFLLPAWLDFLGEKEKKRVVKKLAQTIDAERDGLTFRFSVKATLLNGEKS